MIVRRRMISMAEEEHLQEITNRIDWVTQKNNGIVAEPEPVSSEAIYDWDLTTDNLDWGDGLCRLFGYDGNAHMGTGYKWMGEIHEDDIAAVSTSLALKLNDPNQRRWNSQYRFRKKDGSYAFVDDTGYITRNAAGEALRMIGVMRDMTRQRKERYELKLLESVITNTNDAVMIAQPDPEDLLGFKILYVNAAFSEITGFSSESVCGKSPAVLKGFNSVQNRFDRIEEALTNKQSLRAEILHYERAGRQYFINLSMHPVKDTTGNLTHWIAIGRDVTEKRKYISEIEERNKKLQEIAWMQSHVIRAPLARLMSLVNLIKNYENSAHEQRELLDHIMTSAHALDEIIRDISSKTEKV